MFIHEIYFDSVVVWITTGALILVLGLSIFISFTLWKRSKLSVIFVLITCIVPILITYLYCPKQYSTDTSSLYVHRAIGMIKIDKYEIQYIKSLSSNDLNDAYRKSASGGLFGYFGLYNSERHGDIHVYTGSLKDHLIFIRLKSGKQYLLSPKDVQAFLDSITK